MRLENGEMVAAVENLVGCAAEISRQLTNKQIVHHNLHARSSQSASVARVQKGL
jgi:hypothetical protein